MLDTSVRLTMALLLGFPTLAAAAGAIQLPETGQATCSNGSGTVIACTGTGQDAANTASGIDWPAPRFANNGNGTITDNLTGLVWSQHANAPDVNTVEPFVCANAETDMSWQQALDFIACLNANNFKGFADWRLPNLNELESMLHAGEADTSSYLSANGIGLEGLITLVQPGLYWSSTTDTTDSSAAWAIDMVSGDLAFSSVKIAATPGIDTRGVWPVRGTSSGPARVWKTGQNACFRDDGDPVACTGTGQDGDKTAGAAWPSPRFKSGGNGSYVLDRLTGLIWSTTTQTPGPASPANAAGCAVPGTTVTWQEALDHAACLQQNAYLGISNWRLPNRKEIYSLLDYGTSEPTLPASHPFADAPFGDTYWSSTSDASDYTRAWTVSTFDGSTSPAGKVNGGLLSAWPVSGPDLSPPALTISQGNLLTRVASVDLAGTMETDATVKVSLNGGPAATASSSGTTWSYTIGQLAEGTTSVTVTATDFSENATTASITITRDATAPSLAVNPVSTPTHIASQTIGGTVETGAAVTVTAGGVTAPATVSGTTWSFSINALAPGTNDITVAATDAAGNVFTSSVTITHLNTWDITAQDSPKGTISPSGVVSVPLNGNQTFTFTPSSGYSVVDVLVDGVSQGPLPSYTFTNVAADGHTVKALFIPNGDVNTDGRVDIFDVVRVMRIAVGMQAQTTTDLLRGDVSPTDGSIPVPDRQLTLGDALMILRKAAGLTSGW